MAEAPSLLHIFIARHAREPLHAVSSVPAVAGRGLEGDRYFYGEGTFDRPETQPDGREVSLISLQAVKTCRERLGIDPEGDDLPLAAFRRNLVVDHPDLEALMRRTFTIGDVRLRGLRPAPPCKHLQRLMGHDVMTALKGIGGLRAQILSGGVLHVGDELSEDRPDLFQQLQGLDLSDRSRWGEPIVDTDAYLRAALYGEVDPSD